jgi:hypothetical protein
LLTGQKVFAKMPRMTAAEKLAQHYGDRFKAAVALKMNKETFRLWLRDGIPLAKAVEVEKDSGGVVTAEEILQEAKARHAPTAPAGNEAAAACGKARSMQCPALVDLVGGADQLFAVLAGLICGNRQGHGRAPHVHCQRDK